MAEVCAVHGQDVDGDALDTQSRHDEGPAHLLAGEATQWSYLEGLNGVRGEEPQSPVARFDPDARASVRHLSRGEIAVLAKVQASFAGEVRQERLPASGALPGGDALGAREGHELSGHGEALLEFAHEVRPVVAAPEFGTDRDVGREADQMVEGVGRATPPVDTGVQIESYDTHPATVRVVTRPVWQGLRVGSVNVAFGHRLWWVDAFIGEAERGNPAVVVLLERQMEDAELQQIAFELGVSETAFVRRSGDVWSLRWFTPTVEVDLCGHATLATLHVLLNELGVPGGEFYFHTRSGVLSGRRHGDGLLGVDLPRAYVEPMDPSVLGDTLGPVKEVYQAGASSMLAVVADYDTLCGLHVDTLGLFLVPSSLIIAVCEGGPDVDAAIRVFAPRLGVAEDPVTGSAMCAVAPWWADRTGAPTLSVRQASARGGVMYARLFEKNVEVAGHTRTFFGGDLRA